MNHFLKKCAIVLTGVAALSLFAASALAALPQNTGYVTDLADALTPSEEAQLNAQLDQIEKETTAEIAVLTISTLENQDFRILEDFSYEVFNSWGIGKKDVDNGVLILAVIDDRKFRIETGGGTEGAVVDNNARRISEKHIVPNFRAGDYFAGLSGTATDIAGLISQDPALISEYKDNQESENSDFKISEIAVYFIIMTIIFGPQMVLAWFKKLLKTNKKTRAAGIATSLLSFVGGIFLVGAGIIAVLAILFILFGIFLFFSSIFGNLDGGGKGGSGGGPFMFFGGGGGSSGFGGGGFGGGFGGFGGGGSSGGGFSGGW